MPIRINSDNQAVMALYILHQVNNSLNKCEAEVFKKVEVSLPQYMVLEAINYIGNSCTPSEVADWMDRNANSITLLIDRMEKGGLVTRVRDLKDRRVIRLSITKKGRAVYKRANKPHKQLLKEMIPTLDTGELRELIRLLRKILDTTYDLRELEGDIKKVTIKSE
jgi:DNA-binding MarR family transcriptional regulator